MTGYPYKIHKIPGNGMVKLSLHKVCAIYCVITGVASIELKQVLIDSHQRRQEEREEESDGNLPKTCVLHT